ncbi:MAG: recombinase family protein, partial [Planctomycetes bacterium]|nr:recombinase family protein [Planctomycetota bacterium]
MSEPEFAVILLRNSHESQDLSCGQQLAECETFAAANNLQVLRQIPEVSKDVFENGAFTDDSVSGAATERRRGFQALMEAARNRRLGIRYLIVYDVDRFGRFDSDEAGHWRYVLTQAGVEVLYASEGFTGNESDDLVRTVKQWLGHKYLRDLSRATLRGIVDIVSRGFWPGGIPPTGFDLRYEDSAGAPQFIVRFNRDRTKSILNLDGSLRESVGPGVKIARDESHRPRLHPGATDDIALVNEIFELSARTGDKQIAKTLNERGVPTPRDGNWSKRHKAGWSPGTIANIVKNQAYQGHVIYNKTSLSRF